MTLLLHDLHALRILLITNLIFFLYKSDLYLYLSEKSHHKGMMIEWLVINLRMNFADPEGQGSDPGNAVVPTADPFSEETDYLVRWTVMRIFTLEKICSINKTVLA